MDTNRKPYKLKPRTVTYEQVKAILFDMGHEPDAATIFWRMVTQGHGRTPEDGGQQ